MPIDKTRISLPLEAGSSLLDIKQLPPQLTDALEYASSRLARKGLHLSLIAVSKDVHIPSTGSPLQSPKDSTSPTSPARSLFNTAANLTKSITKHSSRISLKIDSGAGRSLPKNSSPPSSPPASPVGNGPSVAVDGDVNPYGITLMHAASLSTKAEKILRHVISRAEKKYNIGSGWLPSTPLTGPTSPILHDLIRRSLTQNAVLFSSEGLTLLSLDHVYTFKCRLQAYSKSLTPFDLTLAVDELRRLVLAQQGRRITKGYLMRAYDWLGVSLAALVDVNEGYKVAYGGTMRDGGIEVLNEERNSPPPLDMGFKFRGGRGVEFMPARRRRDVGIVRMWRDEELDDGQRSPTESEVSGSEGSEVSTTSSSTSVSNHSSSTLTHQTKEQHTNTTTTSTETTDTTITSSTVPTVRKGSPPPLQALLEVEDEEQLPFHEHTHQYDHGQYERYEELKEDRGPFRRGPVTPNGYEDITPVTKGEWGFLMIGEGWPMARTVAIETC